LSTYQAPEVYVKQFIESVLDGVEGAQFYEEMKVPYIRLTADYGVENIVIEAEPPCKRNRGREQLKENMKKFNKDLGILIDIPIERYHIEYPKPCKDKVGFELYRRFNDRFEVVYAREYTESEITKAEKELKYVVDLLRRIQVAKEKPTPENLIARMNELIQKHMPMLKKITSSTPERARLYFNVWKNTMELVYGGEVLNTIKELEELFINLTIYVTWLKSLDVTLLEAVLGGGRYNLPTNLYLDGYKAAVELFWYRRALTRFNINYLFERDEYDWVFDPSIAPQLDQFFRDIGTFLLSVDWSYEIGLDLLKRIYQNVMPREVRRQLGEFSTPDWIAQLILWRALHILVRGRPPDNILMNNLSQEIIELIDEFYKKHNRVPRFIDPTCGSFTFGVHYINSLLKWYTKKRAQINLMDFAKQIIESVAGTDLNPVAVITARTNYLLQIHRLLTIYDNYFVIQPIIPILRIDLLSIHISNSRKTLDMYFVSRERDVMMLRIPLELLGIEANENILDRLQSIGMNISKQLIKMDEQKSTFIHCIEMSLPLSIADRVKDMISVARAFTALFDMGIQGFENEIGVKLSSEEVKALEKFRKDLLALEEMSLDIVWHSIVVNHALALFMAKQQFDLVLGNLPWVNVSKYPKGYTEIAKSIAKELNVSPPSQAARKLDISVPLFAIALKYLASSFSVTALMVPCSIFRGLHGAAWREYISKPPYTIIEAWDLNDVKPFEGADNQPGIIFILKREALT